MLLIGAIYSTTEGLRIPYTCWIRIPEMNRPLGWYSVYGGGDRILILKKQDMRLWSGIAWNRIKSIWWFFKCLRLLKTHTQNVFLRSYRNCLILWTITQQACTYSNLTVGSEKHTHTHTHTHNVFLRSYRNCLILWTITQQACTYSHLAVGSEKHTHTHTQCVFKILQELSDPVNNYTTNVYVFSFSCGIGKTHTHTQTHNVFLRSYRNCVILWTITQQTCTYSHLAVGSGNLP